MKSPISINSPQNNLPLSSHTCTVYTLAKMQTTSIQQSTSSEGLSGPQPASVKEITNINTLTYTYDSATQSSLDHFQVSSLLQDLNNDEMIKLGTALGLDFNKLKSLPDDMVGAWLRGDDNVIETSGPPNWESLATALDKTGHTKIAITIRRGISVD